MSQGSRFCRVYAAVFLTYKRSQKIVIFIISCFIYKIIGIGYNFIRNIWGKIKFYCKFFTNESISVERHKERFWFLEGGFV